MEILSFQHTYHYHKPVKMDGSKLSRTYSELNSLGFQRRIHIYLNKKLSSISYSGTNRTQLKKYEIYLVILSIFAVALEALRHY
jgi:hypothetical protein